MKKQIPAWLVLAIIMIVAAAALAGTNMMTKDVIAGQAAVDAENARKEVLAAADFFEQLPLDESAKVDSLYVGKKDGTDVGYVSAIIVKGYGGDIEVIAGVLEDGTIAGVNVGGSSFAETAGLGAKAKDPAFVSQFSRKIAPLKVVKAGEAKTDATIDAITAATITSSAVTRGVNDIAKHIDAMLNPVDVAGGVFTPGTATASADGFGGPVAVTVTFGENAAITAISIGDDQFKETPGYGAAALEPEFAAQFMGKTAPIAMADVDAISGATITSEAVLSAINAAYQQLSVPAFAFAAGTATASAEGFAGPVAVTVTFDENATITGITVGDDQFAETPGYGAGALEPAFAEQFVGISAPVAMADVDAISGATITSEAVLDAINSAYKQRMMNAASEPEAAPEPEEAPEEPVADSVEAPRGAEEIEGGITVSKEGFAGPVAVTVLFADDNATIEKITIGDDKFAETEGFGAAALEPAFAEQFVGKKAPLTADDFDGISGATYTNDAVLAAINEAQTQAAAPREEPVQEITVSKEGFAGPVAVTVLFADDKATIEKITIGDDKFAETEGFGAAALEPAFAEQFIGKKAPLTADDFDVISGATYTNDAVLAAINEAQARAAAPREEPVQEITVSKEGFAGPVAVTVLFADDNATIERITIGDDKFAETEGFGAAALEPAFAEQFIGKKVPLTADDFDVISGATYTNDAVLAGINEAQTQAAAPREEPVQEITVSKEGFAGPVAVTVLFADDNATIERITIGDDKFAETEGFGAAALEPAFAEQFVGKKAPLTADDFDGISGATYTNDAVLAAINEAQAQAAAPREEPVQEITVSKEGFAGPVAVTVLFADDKATIEKITIGDDKFAETEGFGAAALEPAFAEQFIGKKAPLTADDFDVISGATYTNDAVLAAINEAQAQAAAPREEPVQEITVSKEGFAGPVAVTVLFADDKATIEKITIGDDKFAETEGFGAAALEPAFAEQFVGKKAPLTADDFDVISGATYTNDAILEAINEAWESQNK